MIRTAATLLGLVAVAGVLGHGIVRRERRRDLTPAIPLSAESVPAEVRARVADVLATLDEALRCPASLDPIDEDAIDGNLLIRPHCWGIGCKQKHIFAERLSEGMWVVAPHPRVPVHHPAGGSEAA